MQLVKLSPEQIMSHWPLIRECVASALPPLAVESDEGLIYVQEQLLLGTLTCWVGTEAQGSTVRVYGVMTTQIVHEPVSKTRNLVIYSVAVVDEHPREMWEKAAEKLSAYARAQECANIIAYSNNPQMIHIAERLGADSTWRLLTFKLDAKHPGGANGW